MGNHPLVSKTHRVIKVGNDLQDDRIQPVTDPYLVTQPRALSATSSHFLDTSRDEESTPSLDSPFLSNPFHAEIFSDVQPEPPQAQFEAVSRCLVTWGVTRAHPSPGSTLLSL